MSLGTLFLLISLEYRKLVIPTHLIANFIFLFSFFPFTESRQHQSRCIICKRQANGGGRYIWEWYAPPSSPALHSPSSLIIFSLPSLFTSLVLMFSLVGGSSDFEEFLELLGDSVTLKGFTGFRGGLDVNSKRLYILFPLLSSFPLPFLL